MGLAVPGVSSLVWASHWLVEVMLQNAAEDAQSAEEFCCNWLPRVSCCLAWSHPDFPRCPSPTQPLQSWALVLKLCVPAPPAAVFGDGSFLA